jgi:hypothetical protein
MNTGQKVQAITFLILFGGAVAAAVQIAVRGWRAASKFKSSPVLFTVGLWFLLAWALRDVWQLGLFGMAFDLRLWILGIALYLLYQWQTNPSVVDAHRLPDSKKLIKRLWLWYLTEGRMNLSYAYTWKDFWLGVLASFILIPVLLGGLLDWLRPADSAGDPIRALSTVWGYMVFLGFIRHFARWDVARCEGVKA